MRIDARPGAFSGFLHEAFEDGLVIRKIQEADVTVLELRGPEREGTWRVVRVDVENADIKYAGPACLERAVEVLLGAWLEEVLDFRAARAAGPFIRG